MDQRRYPKESQQIFLEPVHGTSEALSRKAEVDAFQAKINEKFFGPSGGLKYDGGKPRMDLLVPEAEELTAQVFTFGAEKYGPYNWMEGIAFSRLHAALRRHLAAFSRGEDLDPESGLSHLGHASCCLQMLIWMSEYRKDLDDRPSAELRRKANG